MSAGGQLATAQGYYDDDIYYNPKKDKSAQTGKKRTASNYIADMADMDVDTYNRRGQYYMSPIDTIGAATENGEDFVYTQQIQKYYNPTIVVDNADVLEDILENSYGNVDIEINANGVPVFLPSYPWSYSYRWGWPSWGGWSISLYDPWFSFNWGWGPSWT